MEKNALTEQLKKLRLSGMLPSLEVRIEQASQNNLPHREFLSLLLQDELEHRESHALARRIKTAKFEHSQTFEGFEFGLYPLYIQQKIRDLMCGHYLNKQQNVIIMGPPGTGKTHLAQSLGHHACRQGIDTRFIRATTLFRELRAHKADNSWEQYFKKLKAPQLLIIDDFGLAGLTITQAEEMYELIADRNLRSSFIFTSNRKIENWIELFPEAVMGNAALDRIAHNAHQIILEGESYRKKDRIETIKNIGLNEEKEEIDIETDSK